MTKLDDVARAICCPRGCMYAVSGCIAYQVKDVACQAITAYDTEPSAKEIETAARAMHMKSWDRTPNVLKKSALARAKAMLLAARRVRLAQLEEKK